MHDNENFLASLFAPLKNRNSIWAIRAFNIEISQIQDSITDPTIGKMRIQWWRNNIDSTFAGNPYEHPVSLELRKALDESRLSKSWFKKILAAREKHLSQQQFSTLTDLEEYAENTASSLLYLQLEALGVTHHATEHAIGHIGKAIGITTILRAVPFNLEKRKFYLPSEIMSKVSLF